MANWKIFYQRKRFNFSARECCEKFQGYYGGDKRNKNFFCRGKISLRVMRPLNTREPLKASAHWSTRTCSLAERCRAHNSIPHLQLPSRTRTRSVKSSAIINDTRRWWIIFKPRGRTTPRCPPIKLAKTSFAPIFQWRGERNSVSQTKKLRGCPWQPKSVPRRSSKLVDLGRLQVAFHVTHDSVFDLWFAFAQHGLRVECLRSTNNREISR